MKKLLGVFGFVVMGVLLFASLSSGVRAEGDGFSIQVTPSPIILSIKPGEQRDFELKIRNTGSGDEVLKTGFRDFSVDDTTGNVTLSQDAPDEISDWIKPSVDEFGVRSNEWYTLKYHIDAPEDIGFSYNFAIVIERANHDAIKADETAELRGSVAVFTLISVNKPGATQSFQIESIKPSKKVYEYLPSSIELTLKSTGNSSVRPEGTLYIQRTANSNSPIATFPINDKGGYILPGSVRTMTVDWADGFPVPGTKDGKTTHSWDFGMLSKLRVGRYVAKVITIYDDGTRDVSEEATVSFWVFPWKIMLGGLVVIVLLAAGIWSMTRGVFMKLQRRQKPKE